MSGLSGTDWWLAFLSGAVVGACLALGVVAWLLRERHLARMARRPKLRLVEDYEFGGDAA